MIEYVNHKRTHDDGFIMCPIASAYGICHYIWLIFMVNVGKYTIHGSYGLCIDIMYVFYSGGSFSIRFSSEFAPPLQARHQQHLENRDTWKPQCTGGESVSASGNTEDC